MAEQFEFIIRQLCMIEKSEKLVSDVAATSTRDLTDIWSWNSTVPESVEACVLDYFAATVQKQPTASAICAWDGDLSYQELDTLSINLAYYLVSQGIRQGTIIPLCFEKSMWTPVVMLGVMKVGAASVVLDTSYPVARLQSIVKQVHAYSVKRLILSSKTNQDLSYRLAPSCSEEAVIVVTKVVAQREVKQDLPRVLPEDLLYVVFTSGSTGTPKGVMIRHCNFCSAIKHQQDALGFHKTARVFDYASYAFDAAWGNVLHTLTSGGCLCTPSDHDRRNNVTGSFEAMQCSLALLTPTVWALYRMSSSSGSLAWLTKPVSLVISRERLPHGHQLATMASYCSSKIWRNSRKSVFRACIPSSKCIKNLLSMISLQSRLLPEQ